MPKFTVDNISLETEQVSDDFIVNSVPNNYGVVFKNFEASFTENDFLLIDSNVHKLYGVHHSQMMIIDATEKNKTIQTVLNICEWLSLQNFNKGNHLYVIGGGIIQDIGAFVGNIYKRGIRWTFVPTTLLSQCDSCIGGKTALNFNEMKNQLALFAAPQKVIIDTRFLESLPPQEILSGMGEIVKFFIMGGEYYLDKLDIDLINRIRHGLSIKKAVIEYDEFEKNIRKCLNYGHSFGHAIEAAVDYSIPHGEAVLLGIEIINRLFTKSNIITDIVNKYTSIDKIKHIDSKHIVHLLKHDKKSQLDKITLVVVEPGKTDFIPTLIDSTLENKLHEILTT